MFIGRAVNVFSCSYIHFIQIKALNESGVLFMRQVNVFRRAQLSRCEDVFLTAVVRGGEAWRSCQVTSSV